MERTAKPNSSPGSQLSDGVLLGPFLGLKRAPSLSWDPVQGARSPPEIGKRELSSRWDERKNKGGRKGANGQEKETLVKTQTEFVGAGQGPEDTIGALMGASRAGIWKALVEGQKAKGRRRVRARRRRRCEGETREGANHVALQPPKAYG